MPAESTIPDSMRVNEHWQSRLLEERGTLSAFFWRRLGHCWLISRSLEETRGFGEQVCSRRKGTRHDIIARLTLARSF